MLGGLTSAAKLIVKVDSIVEPSGCLLLLGTVYSSNVCLPTYCSPVNHYYWRVLRTSDFSELPKALLAWLASSAVSSGYSDRVHSSCAIPTLPDNTAHMTKSLQVGDVSSRSLRAWGKERGGGARAR